MIFTPKFSFQFTRPRGARPRPRGSRRGRSCFNSRAREGRDPPRAMGAGMKISFNSRAREGRDNPRRPMLPHIHVSIHAPARGATSKIAPREADEYVSIHAPARGATSDRRLSRMIGRVSIHAPARGATGRSTSGCGSLAVSIHAPARGATTTFCATACPGSFNSRAREGRDGRRGSISRPGISFNSRAREGRDFLGVDNSGGVSVSIHAPARGATWFHFHITSPFGVSIHAPARGATAVGTR